MDISVVLADITTVAVDVIVTAANAALIGGGGVDGAVHAPPGRTCCRRCGHSRRALLAGR